MKITSRNRFFTNAFLAAAVTLLAAAPTAQAARAKKQAAPAPVVAAEPASPYTFEVSVAYDFAINDIVKDSDIGELNTCSLELTGVYTLDEHRAITLRFGYGFGNPDNSFSEDTGYGVYTWNEEWELSRLSLMPGYRYTNVLNEKTKYFVGANIGLVQQSVKFTYSDLAGSESWSDSSIGIGYSAEIGLQYKYSEKVTLLVAYQLSGSTNETEFDVWGEKISTEKQMYHTFRAGVSIKF